MKRLLLAAALCLSTLASAGGFFTNSGNCGNCAKIAGTPTIGDIISATSSTTFGLINDVAVGSCLISGGVATAPSWGACGGGAPALNAVTAATGAVTIASGNNTGIVWNWANTVDATLAFTLGETTAATNGTSTSGVPNQAVLKLSTLAASTASPLTVYSRGTHVFSVSPTNPQILLNDGTNALPSTAFAAATTTGIYRTSGGSVGITQGGTVSAAFNSTHTLVPAGTSVLPGLTDITSFNSGLFWPATNVVGVGNVTDGEWARFISRAVQYSRGSADATAYAINSRKSRGTVAAPTAITTGDSLLTENGYGYVGATNTYLQATSITHNSTGTITDATTGIGGTIDLATSLQGTDTAPVLALRVDSNKHTVFHAGTAPTVTAACGTSPSFATGDTDHAFTLNVGTGGTATSCTVTFNKAWTNAPKCIVNNQGAGINTKAIPTTTTVVISEPIAWAASTLLDVVCFGNQ